MRKQKKLNNELFFTILTVVALSAFAVVFLVSQFYQMRIDGQTTRNQFLKNEIQILDIRIAKIKSLNEKKKELRKANKRS